MVDGGKVDGGWWENGWCTVGRLMVNGWNKDGGWRRVHCGMVDGGLRIVAWWMVNG